MPRLRTKPRRRRAFGRPDPRTSARRSDPADTARRWRSSCEAGFALRPAAMAGQLERVAGAAAAASRMVKYWPISRSIVGRSNRSVLYSTRQFAGDDRIDRQAQLELCAASVQDYRLQIEPVECDAVHRGVGDIEHDLDERRTASCRDVVRVPAPASRTGCPGERRLPRAVARTRCSAC